MRTDLVALRKCLTITLSRNLATKRLEADEASTQFDVQAKVMDFVIRSAAGPKPPASRKGRAQLLWARPASDLLQRDSLAYLAPTSRRPPAEGQPSGFNPDQPQASSRGRAPGFDGLS